ncbi:MAG: RHS repeat-associated core domain-containing protein, partial [Bacteroidota bacterium]
HSQNSWNNQGNIANVGDHFRVSREGGVYTIYRNGAVVLTAPALDPALTVYPYFYDYSGTHHDLLEFFRTPEVNSLDWAFNNGSKYIATHELRRGQDGFMEFTYSGNHAYFGFSNTKDADLSKHYVSLFYYDLYQRMYIYIDGVKKGEVPVPMSTGDKLVIERKGSTVIFSADGVELSYAIDGNLDWHPWVHEYTSGMRNQVKASFYATQGGVCQDYFENLPSSINADPDIFYPPSPLNEDWNLVHIKVYNGEGEGPCHLISEARSYTNEKGQSIQQQSKDYLTGKVWATETIYDYLGRPALASLAAPTGQFILQYQPDFIRDASGNAYGLDDFDRTFNSSGVETSNNTNSPNPVGTQANTLGAWYSSNNTEEPWQAITQYPYTRTEYSVVTGAARYTAPPGDAMKMGSGNQGVSFTMRAGNALLPVLGQKKPLCLLVGTPYDEGGFLSATCSDPGTIYNSRYKKIVAVDADGKTAVSFQDENGNIIAQALSGKVDGSNVQTQTTVLGVPEDDFRDIHVTDAGGGINMWGASGATPVYDVYDLMTDQKIISDGTAHPLNLSPGFYRIVSKSVYITMSYTVNYYNFSLSIYDKRNQLIATVAPNDVVYDATDPQHNAFTFYRYNSYGQLLWEESPDAGRTSYLYRKDGQLRFSQDPQQANDNHFSYIRYDPLGRQIEAGKYTEFTNSFNSLATSVDNDTYPSYEPYKKEEYYMTYDVSDPLLPTNREQQFVQGTLAKITNDYGTTWYSYNEEGQMSWRAQSVIDLSGYKFTDYKYDLLGNVIETIYQEGQSDEFRHHYTYDDNSQMTSASTRKNGVLSTAPTLQAQYQYTVSGTMDKVNLGDGVERKHYVYTLGGSLKAINPKDMATAEINSYQRTFSMALDYYLDDYEAANGSKAGRISNLINGTNGQGNYTGQVAAQRWKARADIGGSDFSGHFAYGYQYNHRNEFRQAQFGNVLSNGDPNYDGAFSGLNDYKVIFGTGAYDLNGNIQQCNRFGQGGSIIDYLNYNYDYSGGRNRLTHISDQVSLNPNGDLGPQSAGNYSYDLNGRMTEDVSEDNRLTYNAAGKVLDVHSIASGNIKVAYKYGPNGHRVRKRSYNSSGNLVKTTWYVRGAGGAVQSIYKKEGSGSIVLEEAAAYGAGRLGTAAYSGGNYTYQYDLKDYLGNVRAVIEEGTNGLAEATYYADYYPYGWTLPGRHGGVSRHGYQGDFAEKDEEVGWNAFELRMYDGRLARWTTVDPFASERSWLNPYNYVQNNPLNRVDPTGGLDEPPIEGLPYFGDDTGDYFWNEELGSYDHHDNETGEYIGQFSFSGIDDFYEPVGEYRISFFNYTGDETFENNAYNKEYTPLAAIAYTLYLGKQGELTSLTDESRYPGVRILASPHVISGVTLGNMIFVNTNYFKTEQLEDGGNGLLEHEYGHYLDYKYHFRYNFTSYITMVGLPSIGSASQIGRYGHDHESNPVEKKANILSAAYFFRN